LFFTVCTFYHVLTLKLLELKLEALELII